jgi:hypothetical protein
MGHLGDEMALLVAAEANGMGLHVRVYLSFARKKRRRMH